ncbi:MAG: hypothetical protein V3V08_13380 [Nannocystaceae bacterium]
MFRDQVYPLLLRDCAFVACHGSERRFFQVFGPGRTRRGDLEAYDEPSAEEIQSAYDRSRAMLLFREAETLPHSAPLLRKPLQGAGHGGVDRFGRNVYLGPQDPSWRVLERWALGGESLDEEESE